MLDGKLSLVLPAYNEVDNIAVVVRRADATLSAVTRDYEIIIVDDGSQDGTSASADQLAVECPMVQVIHHAGNRGYGAALTSGFHAATGEWIMFMDADQQFDIAEIRRLLPYVPRNDIVAGYRLQRRDPLYRRFYATLFGLTVRLLFRLRVRDIDCAFKIFRADLIHTMPITTQGALINTELLARARRQGASIAQVGVHHYPRLTGASSGGSPKVVIRALGETCRLWIRLRRDQLDRGSVPQSRGEQSSFPASVEIPLERSGTHRLGTASESSASQD
ncbi:MAG TPA: glycosyltransferase family 2 protein [Thermomicrobiales bacterium]|nr:glycosyltransferase family 2 protein [Thermomicrobiales bacterium]